MAGKKLGRAKPTMRAGTKVPGDDEINTPRIVMGVAKGSKRNRTKDKDNPSDTKKSGAPAKRERKGPSRWNIPALPAEPLRNGDVASVSFGDTIFKDGDAIRKGKSKKAVLRTSDRKNVNRIRQAMQDIQDAPYKFSRTEPQQFTGIEQFKKDQHRKAKSEGFILTGENTKVYFGDKELKNIADLPKPEMHDICALCGHEYGIHISQKHRSQKVTHDACANVTRIPGRRSVINCLCTGFVNSAAPPEARCAVCTHTYAAHSKAGGQGKSCTTRIPIPTGQTVCTCSAFVHQMPDAEQGGIPMPDSITMTGCELEYDTRRGVLYVHGPHGGTVVRICRIPHVVDIGKYGNTLDVTMGHNARQSREPRAKGFHLNDRVEFGSERHLKMIGAVEAIGEFIDYSRALGLVAGERELFAYLQDTKAAVARIDAKGKKEREQFRSDANKTRLGD